MKKIEAGDVYIGGSGTVYYLISTLQPVPQWKLLYYNVQGEACYGRKRDTQKMTEHLESVQYTYVMNLGDIQEYLNKQRVRSNET
jgi:hypothetical protein